MEKSKVSPYIGLFIAILAVSAAAIFIRMAQSGAPSIFIALLRLGFAALIIMPFALVFRRKELKSMQRPQIILVLISGILLALHFVSWITSLEYTSVTSSVVLVTTSPLWVALLSPVLLKERLTKNQGIGLTLAMIGGIVVGLSNTCRISNGSIYCDSLGSLFEGETLFGNILALAGAIFVSGYFIIGRMLRKNLSLISYTFLVYGSAAIFLLIATLGMGIHLIGFPTEVYYWGFLLAIIPQVIGHSSLNWSLKYLPASYVSIAVLGEPIGSSILAFFILKESPTILEIAGGFLILSGILFASRSQKD